MRLQTPTALVEGRRVGAGPSVLRLFAAEGDVPSASGRRGEQWVVHEAGRQRPEVDDEKAFARRPSCSGAERHPWSAQSSRLSRPRCRAPTGPDRCGAARADPCTEQRAASPAGVTCQSNRQAANEASSPGSGKLLHRVGRRERRELGQKLEPSGSHGVGERRLVIREIGERLFDRFLLSLKQQRHSRTEQEQRRKRPPSCRD